jgi:MarR family transcriptional regulator for hemolysin
MMDQAVSPTFRDEIYRNTAFVITDIARRYRVVFDERVRHLKLSRSEWFLLGHLRYFNGSTQQELCEVMDLTKGGIGKLVDRLERAKLVFRSLDEQDRRTRRVHLTAKAKLLVEDLRVHSQAVEAEALSVLSPAEVRTFNRLLLKVRQGFLERLDKQPAD